MPASYLCGKVFAFNYIIMATDYTNSPYYTSPEPEGQNPGDAPYEASSPKGGPPLEKAEEAQATKSACVVVFLILIVLALIGAATWYYLAHRDSIAKETSQPTENEKGNKSVQDPNFIVAATGGKVVFGGFEVIIPPGALAQDTRIEIEKVAYGPITDRYHLKPDGLKFLKPVTLAIPYKEGGLNEGLTPYDIELGYWFENEFDKSSLRYSVDREVKKLRTTVTEF